MNIEVLAALVNAVLVTGWIRYEAVYRRADAARSYRGEQFRGYCGKTRRPPATYHRQERILSRSLHQRPGGSAVGAERTCVRLV